MALNRDQFLDLELTELENLGLPEEALVSARHALESTWDRAEDRGYHIGWDHGYEEGIEYGQDLAGD